ncbi:uncharacterized protein [Clytia hemisphaerica]|uniref:Uncharacterized protein n=1 Tax=Clytia hemisphaerica TaxID=252671 RepID=A0A7M5V594_9CNID
MEECLWQPIEQCLFADRLHHNRNNNENVERTPTIHDTILQEIPILIQRGFAENIITFVYDMNKKYEKYQPILEVLATMALYGNEDVTRKVLEALPKICNIPTKLMYFYELTRKYDHIKNVWDNQHNGWVHKCILEWAGQFDNDDIMTLLYYFTKYKRRHGHRLLDLWNTSRPNNLDDRVEFAFELIIHYAEYGYNGDNGVANVDIFQQYFTGNPIGINQDISRIVEFIIYFERLKRAQTAADCIQVLAEKCGQVDQMPSCYDEANSDKKEHCALVFEHVLHRFHKNREVWRIFLKAGLPIHRLIWNIRNIVQNESLIGDEEIVDLVCQTLEKNHQHISALTVLKPYMECLKIAQDIQEGNRTSFRRILSATKNLYIRRLVDGNHIAGKKVLISSSYFIKENENDKRHDQYHLEPLIGLLAALSDVFGPENTHFIEFDSQSRTRPPSASSRKRPRSNGANQSNSQPGNSGNETRILMRKNIDFHNNRPGSDFEKMFEQAQSFAKSKAHQMAILKHAKSRRTPPDEPFQNFNNFNKKQPNTFGSDLLSPILYASSNRGLPNPTNYDIIIIMTDLTQPNNEYEKMINQLHELRKVRDTRVVIINFGSREEIQQRNTTEFHEKVRWVKRLPAFKSSLIADVYEFLTADTPKHCFCCRAVEHHEGPQMDVSYDRH